MKRKKVEEEKEAKGKKVQGKENDKQFHQEGTFVVLKLTSDDDDDDIKLSLAKEMSGEGDNIKVKIYRSERKDLYNLLDLPN